MEKALKQFYKKQYRWKRMPHPKESILYDITHPLHQLEVDLSHQEFIVYRLIEAVLSKSRKYKGEPLAEIKRLYEGYRSELASKQEDTIVREYRDYMEATIELLEAAEKVYDSLA